jgi:anhydro-N-acetylmuramic acid kinase
VKIYKAIGLMSGTSPDGVDIAFCTFRKKTDKWSYNLVDCATIPYSKEMKQKLQTLHKSSAEEIIIYDRFYGKYLGKLVFEFCKKNAFIPDFISSHGHTIFHQPENGITFQLGHGASIAAESKMPVVCDFRSLDVALNGQGAPLVPIGDLLLFKQYDYCLNIGGIANVSTKENLISAYDICPANYVLNYLIKDFGYDYDKDGKTAAEGKVNEELLDELNELEYYHSKPPKSLGREWIENNIFPLLKKYKILQTDKLYTYTEHIAMQIAEQFKSKNKNVRLLITGGGAHNKFLTKKLSEKVKANIEIVLPEKNIIDYKEALIFAFLGVLRMEKTNNCLSSVTAASKDNIGGAIYYNQ